MVKYRYVGTFMLYGTTEVLVRVVHIITISSKVHMDKTDMK